MRTADGLKIRKPVTTFQPKRLQQTMTCDHCGSILVLVDIDTMGYSCINKDCLLCLDYNPDTEEVTDESPVDCSDSSLLPTDPVCDLCPAVVLEGEDHPEGGQA